MIDVAVVGGGIVGLATARALQLSGVQHVTILEEESEVGLHQTGRNSGVIHSGLYTGARTSTSATSASCWGFPDSGGWQPAI